MEEIKNSAKVIENNGFYELSLDNNLIKEKITSLLKSIKLNDDIEYILPIEDELTNDLIIRIISEIFISKINMTDNEPYIVIFNIDGIKYKISITKLNIKNEIKYLYGTVMKMHVDYDD